MAWESSSGTDACPGANSALYPELTQNRIRREKHKISGRHENPVPALRIRKNLFEDIHLIRSVNNRIVSRLVQNARLLPKGAADLDNIKIIRYAFAYLETDAWFNIRSTAEGTGSFDVKKDLPHRRNPYNKKKLFVGYIETPKRNHHSFSEHPASWQPAQERSCSTGHIPAYPASDLPGTEKYRQSLQRKE